MRNRNVRQYLEAASQRANEQYLSADGFLPEAYGNFVAPEEGYFGADAGSAAPVPRSKPYIITVSNASASATSNFDVLGAFEYLYATGWSGGSLTVGNCVISSGISNVTYQAFLQQSQIQPFTIGETLITVLSGTATQTQQPITVNTKDANGNQALSVLTPVVSPFQFQSGIVLMKQPFTIDGYTKLTISSILASTVVQFQFYPAANIAIQRGLDGRPVSRQYGAPGIVSNSVAVIGG